MHSLGNHPSVIDIQQDDQAGRKCSSDPRSLPRLCAASGNRLAHGQDPGNGNIVSLWLLVSVRSQIPGLGSEDHLGARTFGSTWQWAAVGFMP